MRMTIRAGMRILLTLSTPFSTPSTTTSIVMAANTRNHTIGLSNSPGSDPCMNPSKNVLVPAVAPFPTAYSTKYLVTHPPMTQ